ncbi:MAG: iron ABC transporter permease [Bacteroidota bacterium]|nr:iron ABC transporter permease [Bacteroidota bacterium]MDX5504801.1 iron ABC transporter permease [Bacteroidota bacterium]
MLVRRNVHTILIIVGILSIALSILFGSVDLRSVNLFDLLDAFWNGKTLDLDQRILWELRIPRAFMTFLVGGILALGGVLTQGLFQNPIVEPGLIGTSSGAAFGASLFFVIGAAIPEIGGSWGLILCAFLGGAIATWVVLKVGDSGMAGKGSFIFLLLTGIAVNAFFLSAVGFLSYLARDPQARSIAFWNLGTTSGASWTMVIILLPVTILGLIAGFKARKPLDALMLGVDEAWSMGYDPARIKRRVMILNIFIISLATAFTGVIAFVGLIIPHVLRKWTGSLHGDLVIGGFVAGGIFLSLADLVARTLLAPAEIPIGIITATFGAPVFLMILKEGRSGKNL